MKNYLNRLTLVLDAVILTLLAFAAYSIRAWWGDQLQAFSFYVPLFVASIVAFLFIAAAVSLYERSRMLFSLSYVSDFLVTYFMWSFFLVAFPFFVKIQYSRVIILFMLITAFIFLYLERLFLVVISATQTAHEPEVRGAVQNFLKLLEISPDPIAFLTGMRLSRPNVIARLAKRSIDMLVSLIAMVPILCAYPVIALLIKRDSPGPVLITQTRIGKNGKPFTMYKFRTMYQNTELYAQAPRKDSDTRVTKVGKVLRKYSIDELPQFLNVLKGDMSLVGPRPEMPFIVEKYAEWQKARLHVKPGITGLWQIFGRKDFPLEENLEYDLYYVFNQSFFLDCAIILQTVPHLISSRGAY